MKGTWANKSLLVKRNKKANGKIFKQMGVAKRLKVVSLNSHLVCVLCSGYYVEATTIVECLHTFCRSCIVKYLQTNNFCPICDVQIHQAKPWLSLRADKILQDLVYKLVPGLYHDEMRRRRQFYSRLGKDVSIGEGEDNGFLPNGARFFSQDDSISLSLEYYSGQEEDEEKHYLSKKNRLSSKPKRYLQCPAAVTVRHLKKFLRMKYGIGLDCWVDIIYNDECLPESFSLIDVAYTFAWNRTSPMRFAYRIFSKVTIRAIRPPKKFQVSRVDEGEGKNSKNKPTLEQQMQSEYLGNFNLNPTNSGFCKSQNCNKGINSRTINNNHNNSTLKSSCVLNEKKDEYFYKNCQEIEEGSRDKVFQSSEESNTSGLRIISEKEESVKGNSEDSRESLLLNEKKNKSNTTVPNFGEDAVDSFTAKKLLKNKHKLEEKKRKLGVSHGEKRRKSAGHTEDYVAKKSKFSIAKRRKTVADEFSLRRENEGNILNTLPTRKDESVKVLGNLKNEALRKVFVTKEKPENNNKRKEEEIRKKKRKKSKHHENEPKKRKLEITPSSPSIMSFAKDALKLKVKLTPSKPLNKSLTETNEHLNNKKSEAESDKTVPKPGENDNAKSIADKERLLHLRAVRHKTVINKNNPKEFINAPPSLTISKVDSNEQQSVKSTLIESKPSLEIMLVSPNNTSKVKIDMISESRRETESKKVESPKNETRHSEVVDNFGVLDLSEKSTRTKENSSNSPPSKDTPETTERSRKTTHQSIMQIAQNLVNRKLSPVISKNNLKSGFDVPADSSSTSAAMRNLKTLSDTAVNILMAAQNKSFPTEPQKRPFPPPVAVPSQISITSSNSTNPLKDCENAPGLKIPVYPMSRDRMHSLPSVPNLHEIYPRGQGRSLLASKPSTPIIKPGQNQTVRQIPNPFVVLNRQGNQNQNSLKPPSPQPKPENNDEVNLKHKLNSIPPLQNLKTKSLISNLEDIADLNSDKNRNDCRSLLISKTTTITTTTTTTTSSTTTTITTNTTTTTNTTNNNNNNNINNNKKKIQNGSECDLFGMKNGEERRGVIKLNNSSAIRKIENMAKNIESVAAGLTARAASNAMIDAK